MSAIRDFLAQDHDRLDAYLSRAAAGPAAVALDDYEAFRKGLLKHIGMEEIILLPAAKRAQAGKPVALAQKIRLDHGAITALLVPNPTPAIIAAIKAILEPHNRLEEEEGAGLYIECERALGPALSQTLEALSAAPDIPPSSHADGPRVMAVVRRALDAAGYTDLLPR